MSVLVLEPGAVSLDAWAAIYRKPLTLGLTTGVRLQVERSREAVARAAAADAPVYGINTGFGKLASVRIGPADVATLQRNLLLSHCAGVGEPVPVPLVRLMLALKVVSLGRGASGVRWELVELLLAMLDRDVVPVVPCQGSVGASGDLAPLAHLAAVLIGEGEATVADRRLPGAKALRTVGLEPLELEAKEGLALINGTQFSTAYALAAWLDVMRLVEASMVIAALSTDAAMGSTAPLRPAIHALRGHPGQIAVATAMRRLLDGSAIRESHREDDDRVQDPYCLRCQPQVLGAALDLLRSVGRTLEIEANAVTDNPIVETDGGVIVSGGNFHAEPVAFAADQIALAIAEIGAIAQRRIALLVDPTLSCDLPPFLASEPGLHSGFMIAEVTSAALMSENKQRAAPCSVDSTPTSCNQEDHVSMAAHGARRLGAMVDNLAHILAIEWLCAAQGVEFRAPLQTSEPLQAAVAALRREVPALGADRPLAPDIERAAALIRSGDVARATGMAPFVDWDELR